MLVDQNNTFLSQRTVPKMALIHTQINHQELILSTSAQNKISLPLYAEKGESLQVDVWKDQCQALAISPEIDQWLSEVLHLNCRLVYQPADSIRTVDPNYAKPTDQVAFSDGFPFLLISEGSLLSLNQAMSLDLPITRFRPNLVVSGCDAYSEDSWREISINRISFRLPKPCSRCAVPTIDPETALKGKEPLRTLNRLRKWNKHVFFGQNVLHDGCGELTVGDRVEIIRTGPRQPPL